MGKRTPTEDVFEACSRYGELLQRETISNSPYHFTKATRYSIRNRKHLHAYFCIDQLKAP
jgi:hypothetical protein